MNKKEELLAKIRRACDPVVNILNEDYVIPVEKMDRVAEYTIMFVGKNFRHMTVPRMARKIAEYFKLKTH